MAHRCIKLANRGLGSVPRQFRVIPVRSVAVASFDVTAANSSYHSSSQRSQFFDNNNNLQQRSYSSSIPTSKEYAPNPLDAFRDPVDRQTRMQEPVGRQWSVKELRRKSYEDLHRLWYVLYKEKNMLLTEQQLSRRRQLIFPQPERFQKVQKSMGAIRQVLGERKQKAVAAHLERHREKELAMISESESQDTAEYLEMEETETTK